MRLPDCQMRNQRFARSKSDSGQQTTQVRGRSILTILKYREGV